MSWVPPVTYVAGTVLSSADIRECQASLSAYLDQIPGADVDTKAWVLPSHIVRGTYDGVRNRMLYASGQFGSVKGGHSFLSSLQVKGDASGQGVSIPGPTATLDVPLPGTLFVTWWAQAYSPGDLTGSGLPRASFYLRVGTTSFSSESRLREEDATSTIPAWEQRYPLGGFTMIDLPVGRYDVQVVGATTGDLAKSQIIRYGLTYELFSI